MNTAAAELFRSTVSNLEGLIQQQRLGWFLEAVVIDDWVKVVKDFVSAITTATKKWQFSARMRVCDGV